MKNFDLDKFLVNLETWVVKETPSENPQANQQFLTWLAQQFEHLNPVFTPGQKSGGCLTFSISGTGPKIGLVGHVDTVWPVGTLVSMPFKQEGDLVFGPGVFDMKAGALMAMTLLDHFSKVDEPPNLMVWLNTDEEIGSPESSEWALDFAKTRDAILVLEPSNGPEGHIKTERRGMSFLKLSAKGKSAHAGLNPEAGINAIVDLSHWIQQIQDIETEGAQVSVGTIQGGTQGNVVPEYAEAIIDLRADDESAMNHVLNQLKQCASQIGAVREVNPLFWKPPLKRTERNQKLWEQIQNGLAGKPRLVACKVGGASDGNTTSQVCATLDGFGAIGGKAHARGEFIQLSATIERLHLLARLIENRLFAE